MEIDGYEARRNEDFSFGEEYNFYKNNVHVGWMRFYCGILAVSTSISASFLHHDLYGEECIDEFASSKERRKALRFAVGLLEKHYGDAPPTLKTVMAIFPGAVVEPQEQMRMFDA